jgi:hypothetical protein
MDSRNPLSHEAENKSQLPYHYTTGRKRTTLSCVPSFDFYRFRFRFQALDPVSFPATGSANIVRGAWGTLLSRVAPPEIYRRLFAPAGTAGPSGLADRPRPFVFRAAHFDAHVFDLQRSVLPYFQMAFAELASAGLGPARGRARLQCVEQVDLEDRSMALGDVPETPLSVPLEADCDPVDSVMVRFVTPTELKAAGRPADRPEFAALFARIRDRIATLCSLYGSGPLQLDFRGMGERAAAVVLRRCDLTWENATRKSSRTGQVHPLGGFTGEAEYQGVLTEFVPWLRAARWCGVGRQTVWGKGDLRVLDIRRAAPQERG